MEKIYKQEKNYTDSDSYIFLQLKEKSTKMAHFGYEKDRFINLVFDNFDCLICLEVIRDPMECGTCGKLFCKLCISDWINKNSGTKCPNRCTGDITPIKSAALKKMYNNLDIKCSNPKCGKAVKLFDLLAHEEMCLKVKCWNYENCDKVQNQMVNWKVPCCSKMCMTLDKLVNSFGNAKRMYEILDELGTQESGKVGSISPTNESLGWDTSRFGSGIIISDGNTHAFLKEQPYVFRSVMANVGFTGGVNYWEIVADPRTENEIKIGVTSSKDFDHNSAFCDHSFGYAYYGLGQLRHASNATGPSYGKRFKKEGVLGICLNMDRGTLSFALNGEFMGIAYQDERLKQGRYYPAVSLLHCAGCKIRGGMPVPAYFGK